MHAIQNSLLLTAMFIQDRKTTPGLKCYQNMLRLATKKKKEIFYNNTMYGQDFRPEENYKNRQLYKIRHSTDK